MTETSCKVCGIGYFDASGFAEGDWRYRTCPRCRRWATESGYPVIQIDFETIEERMIAHAIDQDGERSTAVFRATPEAAQLLVQSYRAAHPDIVRAADVFDSIPSHEFDFRGAISLPSREDWERPDYVPGWAESKERYTKR